jgi:hypothetical protein
MNNVEWGGQRVESFSFPYDNYAAETVSLVREAGFKQGPVPWLRRLRVSLRNIFRHSCCIASMEVDKHEAKQSWY